MDNSIRIEEKEDSNYEKKLAIFLTLGFFLYKTTTLAPTIKTVKRDNGVISGTVVGDGGTDWYSKQIEVVSTLVSVLELMVPEVEV